MSYLGWPSLCIRVSDLEASKAFYLAMGLELVSEVPDLRVILGLGSFRIALMTFLDENLINVRGGDPELAFAELKAAFPSLEGEPQHYRAEDVQADADGCCWSTRDPDGNNIFFDTNELEAGADGVRRRTLDILQGAAAELAAMGADASVLRRLEDDVIAPYLERAGDE